jgi:hypothetical protein
MQAYAAELEGSRPFPDPVPGGRLELVGGDTFLLSHSTLEKIQHCPQLAGYHKCHGRVPAGPGSPAAGAGGALHDALKARYLDRRSEATRYDWVQGEVEIEKAYSKMQMPEDDYRTQARMMDVFAGYAKAWPEEPFRILGCEIPFAVELGTVGIESRSHHPLSYNAEHFGDGYWLNRIRIVWRGLIDLLVDWDGEIFVMDHKTMKDYGPMQLTQYENSGQAMGYAWAIQQLHASGAVPEFPARVHGFALNAIVVRPLLTRPTAKSLPREEYHRQRWYYSQERLNEWRENTLLAAQIWLQQWASGRFVMNTGGCANFYGRACPYLQVCSLPPEQRLLMLGTDLFADAEPGPLDQPIKDDL